jgi:hypothetical protein
VTITSNSNYSFLFSLQSSAVVTSFPPLLFRRSRVKTWSGSFGSEVWGRSYHDSVKLARVSKSVFRMLSEEQLHTLGFNSIWDSHWSGRIPGILVSKLLLHAVFWQKQDFLVLQRRTVRRKRLKREIECKRLSVRQRFQHHLIPMYA